MVLIPLIHLELRQEKREINTSRNVYGTTEVHMLKYSPTRGAAQHFRLFYTRLLVISHVYHTVIKSTNLNIQHDPIVFSATFHFHMDRIKNCKHFGNANMRIASRRAIFSFNGMTSTVVVDILVYPQSNIILVPFSHMAIVCRNTTNTTHSTHSPAHATSDAPNSKRSRQKGRSWLG